MWWPVWARRRAVAAPMPRLPPVMTVTGAIVLLPCPGWWRRRYRRGHGGGSRVWWSTRVLTLVGLRSPATVSGEEDAVAGVGVGDLVADFELPDETGRPRRLSEFLAVGPVVLFFYPAAMTRGCT
ncbi:redoxin domain-containing protein, partial [Micromonospora craterilacus]|uniref:redoxin domain-containing protein n=1 Tax=Micromonospora craterilacus TaxID=1655439 RepID=UPI002D767147